MKRILIGIALLACLISGYANAATYTFTGNNFTSVNGVYTTAMKITGSVTTSVPIPPNSTEYDISGILTSWSFFDGVQTINNTNGTLNPLWPPAITTDSMGNITQGRLFVLVNPIATEVGQLNSYISLDFGTLALDDREDLVKKDAECLSVVNGFCATHTSPHFGYNDMVGGVWVTSDPPSVPIPAMSQWSLMLLALLLGMVGITRIRRQV